LESPVLILEKAETQPMKELPREKLRKEYAPRRASVKPAAAGGREPGPNTLEGDVGSRYLLEHSLDHLIAR
jgi:hypothetical protein